MSCFHQGEPAFSNASAGEGDIFYFAAKPAELKFVLEYCQLNVTL